MKSAEKIVNRWKKAFPLAGFKPVLKAPSEEDQRLAQKFCPLLFADSKLIEEEKADLSKNLGVGDSRRSAQSGFMKRIRGRDFKGVTNALFLFRVGRFPRDLTGGKIGILGVDLPESEIPWDKEMRRVLEHISERLQKEYAEQYFEYLSTLFTQLFPTLQSSTCVIKYRVDRDPADSNIYCIQYFAYWPIQLLPRHWFDYEPIYVIIRKEGKTFEPLLIIFNADYGAGSLLRGKRPGHIIRTFMNWDCKDLQITPDDYNPMADYMTKAFGRSYYYQPIPRDPRKSHIDNLNGQGHPIALHVPTKWHSYELATSKLLRESEPLDCALHPLKSQDLIQIEWDIRNPFQAPFLYPTVGGKNALMHFPLNVRTLWRSQTYHRWSDFAFLEYHIKHGRPSQTVSNMYAYQVGLFIDIFSELSGESMGLSMWPLIEAREREIEGTLSLFQRLRRSKD